MAIVLHLRCQGCGGRLQDRSESYCTECNWSLAYRAMPFILGMLLAPAPFLAPLPVRCWTIPVGRHLYGGYDDENALTWE